MTYLCLYGQNLSSSIDEIIVQIIKFGQQFWLQGLQCFFMQFVHIFRFIGVLFIPHVSQPDICSRRSEIFNHSIQTELFIFTVTLQL